MTTGINRAAWATPAILAGNAAGGARPVREARAALGAQGQDRLLDRRTRAARDLPCQDLRARNIAPEAIQIDAWE